MLASRFKSRKKRFENCIVRPAKKMDVPGSAGAFLFGTDNRACSIRMWRTKMEAREASEHPFCLTPPFKGSAKPIPPSPPDQMLPRNCGAFLMPVSKGAKRTLRTFTSEENGRGKARNDALQYNTSWFLIHLFKLIFAVSINKIRKKYKKTCASQTLRIYSQAITCA